MKKYKKQYTKMTTLAFRIENDLVQELDKRTVNGLTRSDVLRTALQQLISKWLIVLNVIAIQKLSVPKQAVIDMESNGTNVK